MKILSSSMLHLTKFELRKSVDLGLNHSTYSVHSCLHRICIKLSVVDLAGCLGGQNPPQFWKNNYADRLEPQLLKYWADPLSTKSLDPPLRAI